MKKLVTGAALVVAIACITACAVPPPPNVSGAGPARPFVNLGPSIEARLLTAHNRERAAVGSVPLQWDSQLQQAAAAYARELAATGQFQHAPIDSLQRQGENLWTGTRGVFRPEAMVADWASGRRQFQPGFFPNVSRTGNWTDVGHYTQIIWPQTRSVGCAISSSVSFDFLVCRYLPAGNVRGVKLP